MRNILYFDWFSGGTEFYRLLPLSYIKGITIDRSTENNITFATLSGYDTIIICRPSSLVSLNLIKMAKDMQIRVISDWDDDCLHIDEYNPMWDTYEIERRNVMECLALSDEVWVSTEGVKKSFRLYNNNIHVIPNAHNDYVFPVKDKRPFTFNKKALWRGGDSHEGDMYDNGVAEKVVEMVNGNPDWEFIFIGQRFKWLEKRCGKNYIAKGGDSTVQFHKKMQSENACVGWYPLADTVFNRGKSNIFWVESTYAGSAVFGNTRLSEFNKISIGRIEELNTIIQNDSEESLKIMNQLSWDYICDNLLLSNINKLREERLT